MATGRIGVTPTLRTRWSKAPAGGTTSLSGLDDNSVSLVYDVGYEAVYRNGVLLSRTNDYTATTGNSITLIDATIAGDIIEVFANQLLPLTNAIGNGQYTAKGALLSATAASTPAVLTVGSNDQVLTADSTTSTGLKWATPAAGGMTLISTTSLTGSSVSLTSIPGTYKDLRLVVRNFLPATDGKSCLVKFNSDTGSNYAYALYTEFDNQTFGNQIILIRGQDSAVDVSFGIIYIWDYANTATWKTANVTSIAANATTTSNYNTENGGAFYKSTSAITSIQLSLNDGASFTSGTALLYGVS